MTVEGAFRWRQNPGFNNVEGRPMTVSPPTGSDVPPGDASADLACFFGPRGAAYLDFHRRRRLRSSGRRWPMLGWSWPACYGWTAWFWYRKMWAIGLAATVLPAAASLVPGGWAGLVAYLAVVLLAKEYYCRAADRAIALADAKGLTGAARQMFLRGLGGTSPLFGALGAAVAVGLTLLSVLTALSDILGQLDAAGLLPLD